MNLHTITIPIKRTIYRAMGMRPTDMPMVQYWKNKESVAAKVMRAPDGSTIMRMEGEPEPFPGFPRGYLLYGKLSKLKHEIKNQIFNWAWYALEEGKNKKDVLAEITGPATDRIIELAEETKFDRVPYDRMNPAVREIYRAWTKVSQSAKSRAVRDFVCFILQEDDAYRFRVQWLADYNPRNLDQALSYIEHAEVIDDMKERERLWRRTLVLLWEHLPEFRAILREINWAKVRLTSADKYHFRGKYFRVDLDKFDY